jgi:uncharacterized protein (DUF1697 family)
MTTYLAFLRGINVGGRALVSMSDLREMLGALGLAEPRSLLASGNLLFRSRGGSPEKLEQRLEIETHKRLGLRPDYFVRSAEEWARVLSRNPFGKEAERDPGHLIVLLLKKAPGVAQIEALRGAIVGREVFHGDGRHAYVVYPDGMGRSKLTNAAIEKALGTRATARNWNTARKLGALAGV